MTRQLILTLFTLTLALCACDDDEGLSDRVQGYRDAVEELICEFCDRCPGLEEQCPDDMDLEECLDSYVHYTDDFWENLDGMPECADAFYESAHCEYMLSCADYAQDLNDYCAFHEQAFADCINENG